MTRRAIIAQPLPEFQDTLFVGLRQVVEGWERREEPLEVWHNGRDGRLLEHDLADPECGMRRDWFAREAFAC